MLSLSLVFISNLIDKYNCPKLIWYEIDMIWYDSIISYLLSITQICLTLSNFNIDRFDLIAVKCTAAIMYCLFFQLIALVSAWRYVTSDLRMWRHPRFCTANILHQGNVFFDLILHCASYIEENLQREFTEQLVSSFMFQVSKLRFTIRWCLYCRETMFSTYWFSFILCTQTLDWKPAKNLPSYKQQLTVVSLY